MRQISKWEDLSFVNVEKNAMIDGGNEKGRDWLVEGPLLNKAKLVVLPVNNPPAGTFGCIAFEKQSSGHADEMYFTYTSNVFDEAETVVHDTLGSFQKTFNESIEKDLPCFECDDPKRLRVGYLILKNSGNEWHVIRLSDYRKAIMTTGPTSD